MRKSNRSQSGWQTYISGDDGDNRSLEHRLVCDERCHQANDRIGRGASTDLTTGGGSVVCSPRRGVRWAGLYLWILSISMSLLVSGCQTCTKSITFAIVDAATGQPLAGVHVTQLSRPTGRDNNTVPFRADTGVSNADGIIEIGSVLGGYINELEFSKAGFHRSGVSIGPVDRPLMVSPILDNSQTGEFIEIRNPTKIPLYRVETSASTTSTSSGR
jgi:hypothetical protein